jgi:ComF family protein
MKWWQNLITKLFPSYCLSCFKTGPWLCEQCWQLVVFLPSIPTVVPLNSTVKLQSFAITKYSEPTSLLIQALKFQFTTDLAAVFADWIWQAGPRPAATLLTNVPAHPAHHRHRGYDQTALIAQELSQRWQVPYQPLLKRSRRTRPQSQMLNPTERAQNIAGAFELVKPTFSTATDNSPTLDFSHIVIIDDVITTGATLTACTKALLPLQPTHLTAIGVAQEI